MSSNAINLQSFQSFADLINRVFTDGLDSVPQSMKQSGFVKAENVPAETGATRRREEMPHSEEYAKFKPEGGSSITALIQQGYSKDTISRTYSANFVFTLEWRRLGKDAQVKQQIQKLQKFIPNREDLDLSMFFSFGTSTSYTDLDGNLRDVSTGDGLSLFNSAHTLTGSTTTYRNQLAGNPQISRGALESMEQLIVRETYNNLGQNVAMDFDIIATTNDPNTVNTTRELLQSTASVSAPNAGVTNVYKAKYKHVVLNRIDMDASGNKDVTKAKQWGLICSGCSSFYHDIFIPPFLTTPTAGSNGEDIYTMDWTFTTTAAWGSCIVDARWIKWSRGDASA